MFGIETRDENIKFFYNQSPINSMKFISWTKKRGVKFYTFICVGGGAAGGNGFSGAAASNRGGGGGGGSGAISRLRIPAALLPDTLYLYPGKGGKQGGTTIGEISGVFLSPRVNAMNVPANFLLRSGASNAAAGGNGTAAAAGAAGVVSTLEQTAGCIFSAWGVLTSIGGSAGIIGGVHTGAAGGAVTSFSIPLTGGAGGAGCGVSTTQYAGGSITVATGYLVPSLLGGIAGGGNGLNGFKMSYPLMFSGGTGGGSSNAGVGGNGGNGAIGCGGGGGGAGVTGGTGGDGGDGLIIVIEEY
jgi:hypothetical protein